MFCQRLGLETGWNCHISLGEGSGATLVDECSSSAVSDSCPLLQEDETEGSKYVGSCYITSIQVIRFNC